MNLDKERLELLRTVLIHEEDYISFYPKGSNSDKGYWYVNAKDVQEAGPASKGGDQVYESRSDESLIELSQKHDLVAEISLYDKDGRYMFKDETFEDWEHLARYLGISELVAISTKVPKNVAKKFDYYATMTGTKSEVLRNLVYDYVKEAIKDNAERDMFHD